MSVILVSRFLLDLCEIETQEIVPSTTALSSVALTVDTMVQDIGRSLVVVDCNEQDQHTSREL